jgi:hypothetical protein
LSSHNLQCALISTSSALFNILRRPSSVLDSARKHSAYGRRHLKQFLE